MVCDFHIHITLILRFICFCVCIQVFSGYESMCMVSGTSFLPCKTHCFPSQSFFNWLYVSDSSLVASFLINLIIKHWLQGKWTTRAFKRWLCDQKYQKPQLLLVIIFIANIYITLNPFNLIIFQRFTNNFLCFQIVLSATFLKKGRGYSRDLKMLLQNFCPAEFQLPVSLHIQEEQ